MRGKEVDVNEWISGRTIGKLRNSMRTHTQDGSPHDIIMASPGIDCNLTYLRIVRGLIELLLKFAIRPEHMKHSTWSLVKLSLVAALPCHGKSILYYKHWGRTRMLVIRTM